MIYRGKGKREQLQKCGRKYAAEMQGHYRQQRRLHVLLKTLRTRILSLFSCRKKVHQ